MSREERIAFNYKILIQGADALEALYDKEIIHWDLKHDNFMLYFKEDEFYLRILSKDFSCINLKTYFKLVMIDFGTATDLDWWFITNNEIGNTGFRSPDNPITSKSDLWSFGCIMIDLLWL